MFTRTLCKSAFVAALACILITRTAFAQDAPKRTIILDTASYWRTNMTFRVPVYLKDGLIADMPTEWRNQRHVFAENGTALPAEGWMEPDFDDSEWVRLASFPCASVNDKADRRSAWMALLAVRGKFGVKHPSNVKDLSLDIEYRGGIVVYLNGKEIAREHLAKGGDPLALADPRADDEKQLFRTLRCQVPSAALRKGTNVLAIEVHRAALKPNEISIHLEKWPQGVNIEKSTCGLERLRLDASADSADALVTNVSRPKGLQAWNSNPLASDFDVDYGDPFETLRPVLLVGTRNGSFSAKVVVGCDQPLRKLRGTISDLRRAGGAETISAKNVKIGYALPGNGESGANPRYVAMANRLEILEDTPLDGIGVYSREAYKGRPNRYSEWDSLQSPGVESIPGAVCAVWMTVQVPKDAAPGDYNGTLTISAEGEGPVAVPVGLTVSAWTLPDPCDYRTFAEVIQSPETLAMGYKVPLWSDGHFALIERSLKQIARSGAPSVYIPLICETNLGNSESMVRWIRNDDGTFAHDFSVMERYLDLVEKHSGRPRLVCFWMWDTFLDRVLGGRGDEKWNEGDVVKALEAAKGRGPDVTLYDPKSGRTEKMEMPQYTDPKSQELWKPLADELIARMRKRGWLDSAMLGTMCDYQPSEASREHLLKVFPGMRWVSHAHLEPRKDLPVGCKAVVFMNWAEYRDPSIRRAHGWNYTDVIDAHFPRLLRPWFLVPQIRLVNEINLARGAAGSARFGGDFFQVLEDSRGRLRGMICGRFPKSHWHNLRIEVNFLEKGRAGAVSTSLYEMFIEGVQECEARIAVEKALADKTSRARLGEQTAARLQELLDERMRDVRSGAATFCQSEHYYQHHTDYNNWWQVPCILGGQWYSASGWQQRSKLLFDAAAEVAEKLK